MLASPIAVIGAGSWGTALAIALGRNGNAVHIWGPELDIMQEIASEHQNSKYLPDILLPDTVTSFETAQAALIGVETVLLVVPSHVFLQCLQDIKPFLPNNAQIAWGTKGLDPDSDQFMHEIVQEVFGADTAMGVVAGPSFALEVARGLPTVVNIAANNKPFANTLKTCFQQDNFQCRIIPDMVGMQLAGAMKNVIAIATGLSDGLGYAANTRAALITRGLQEMRSLGLALGAQSDTFFEFAGLGDLILTCSDDQSRNRRFGLALGQGKTAEEAFVSIGQVVEGAHNAKQVNRLAKKHGVELVICKAVNDLIHENGNIQSAIAEIFK